MIKLPARQDGQWTVVQSSDKLPDIVSTKNLTFDKEGYLRLSKPTAAFVTSADDADLGMPVLFSRSNSARYYILTQKSQFYLDLYNSGNYGAVTLSDVTGTDTPVNTQSLLAGADIFNQKINYLNPTDQKTYYLNTSASPTTAWTVADTSASLEVLSDLSVCPFVSNSTLAVGNDNQVDQLSTAYAVSANQLQLPNDYSITGLAYNNSYLGITTHAKNNFSRCMFYVWDGKTTAANYVAEVPSTTAYSPVPYKGSFAFLSGNGVLYYWTPSGLEELATLPSYYSDSTFAMGKSDNNQNQSITVEGDVIHINLNSALNSPTENGSYYQPEFAGGIWTYDPAVGLYHRHSPSGTKVLTETIATTAVNTATDEITVTTAYETGTPVRYYSVGGTALAGLATDTLYYTIYVDATTIQLATSYENAVAGTAIDLTGTGNNNQSLHYHLKSDFGQSYLEGQQGVLYTEGTKAIAAETPIQTFLFGAECAQTGTTEVNVAGFTVKDTENRGNFVTGKMYSSQLQDHWQKVYIKHAPLVSALDTLVIKYRTQDDGAIVGIKETSSGLITWTDSTTFTTTDSQFASVLAGDEVEIVQGTGAGYLAHISAISEASGTYTVTLDETIKNLTAAQTGRVVVSRWTKLSTITKDTVRNDDGYSEITVGKKSKMIQFKVELRGEDIEIEELLISNTLSKPV